MHDRLISMVRVSRGPLAFGLRVWASVVLALLLAYVLQLENPFWAGTSAAIVCQPTLGTSLRKARFRLTGTVIGSTFSVLLVVAFPQDRVGFVVVLATWCGLCASSATILQDFGRYAAALAGYTAVIVAVDAIAEPSNVFLLAVSRGTEISLGILCAVVVSVITSRGTARQRAAKAIAEIVGEICIGLLRTCERPAACSLLAGSGLISRMSGLTTLLDEAVGENPDLSLRSGTLTAALHGLQSALSSLRVVATHMEYAPAAQARKDAAPVLGALRLGSPAIWMLRSSPAEARDQCRAAARSIGGVQVATQSAELVLVSATETLLGLSTALNGVALLLEPGRAEALCGTGNDLLPDVVPALVNGIRAFCIILASETLWIVTGWTNGASAVLFAAVVVLLLSPQGEAAVSAAWQFLGGTVATSILVAVVNFAFMPSCDGFISFAAVLGMVLVPLSAAGTSSRHQPFFTAAAANFTPLLAPSNSPTYDVIVFCNSTIAVIAGVAIGAIAMSLLPQLSPERRAGRLRSLALSEFRRLARDPGSSSHLRWETLLYGRRAFLPGELDQVRFEQVTAVLCLGSAALRVHQWAKELDKLSSVQPLLAMLAAGQVSAANPAFKLADLAFLGVNDRPVEVRRARAALLALQEALALQETRFSEPTSSQ